jgi:hypothetical protein
MKKKIVKSKKRVPKFQNGGIGKLKPRTALEAAKDLKIGPFVGPLNEADTAAKDKEKETKVRGLIDDLITPKSASIVSTPKSATTPKSVAAKNSKIISDSYKKSLQGLMDKGKSVDELVKLGYGTKQGLTNLGLTTPKKVTAPKKATAPKKVTAPKKATATKPTTPKKPTASDLKKEGQRLKAEGMKQKGIGMAIKGKGLRNKAIAETRYIKIGTSQDPITTKLREISKGKKQTKEVKYLPNKSVLTETEKKAIAKYKASPKYKKSLKVDSKKFSSDELAKSNYGNNIVGDLISGPVKGAVAAGVGLYGLYKGIKGIKSLKGAAAKLVKKSATEATEAVAKSKKSSLKFNANRLQARSKVNKAQKEGLEGLTKIKDVVKNSATKTKDVVKNSALKPDRILKPIKRAIPRSTNAGKTIKAKGRTVSEGSQKLLGNGQKMLGNGQKMLGSGQKMLGSGQKMLGNTKGLPAPKKGLSLSKFRNVKPKPKPGEQLKFNFRKGGKITKMKKVGKKC